VTQLCTGVVTTFQGVRTGGLATIGWRRDLVTGKTIHSISTMASYLQHLLALPTIPLVAELLAGMDPTPQHLLTLLATEHQVPTLPSPAGLGTGTQHCDHSSAGRAGPSMAQLHTLVHTASYSPGSLTHLPTAVGHQAIVPVPLRIPHLPAEAPVVSGEGGGYHLAPRAPPSPTLCGGCLGPLLDATKVENLEAVMAIPGRLHLPHPLQAHHALSQPTLQLLGQTSTKIHIFIIIGT